MPNSTRSTGTFFRVGWLVVILGLVAGLSLWSASIGMQLGATRPLPAIASPPPVKAVPTVVTDYSNTGKLDKAQLCAELAPRVNAVTVENTRGEIIQLITC